MGKFEAKKQKKSPMGVIALILVLAVFAGVGFLLMDRPDNPEPDVPQTQPAQSQPTEQAAPETQPPETQAPEESAPEETLPEGITLPLTLEDGKLELEMLFQYSGINPDCGNQEGKDIAAIQLRNTSALYLQEAKLALTLADGTVLNYLVTDLPAGGCVMAFCAENATVAAPIVLADIICEAEFVQSDLSAADKVNYSIEGVTVTVENISGQDLDEIVVYCRGLFGEDYFGGITYQYTIETLPAGETATVDAWDCVLGMAEVVRVSVSES